MKLEYIIAAISGIVMLFSILSLVWLKQKAKYIKQALDEHYARRDEAERKEKENTRK